MERRGSIPFTALLTTEKLFVSYLNFYYNLEWGCLGTPCFKPNKTNKDSENKIIIYLYKQTVMKTLTLHTNCSQPTLRNEWAGIRMFSTLSNPANLQLGKVDYISTKQLEDTDVG